MGVFQRVGSRELCLVTPRVSTSAQASASADVAMEEICDVLELAPAKQLVILELKNTEDRDMVISSLHRPP